jgi:hypothetical protein
MLVRHGLGAITMNMLSLIGHRRVAPSHALCTRYGWSASRRECSARRAMGRSLAMLSRTGPGHD